VKRVLPLVVVALLAGGCGGSSIVSRPAESAVAARVNGVEITQDELTAEADQLDELSQGGLTQQYPATGEGTYSTDLLSQLLTQRISGVVLADELADEGIEVTADDRSLAEQTLTQQLADVDQTTGQPVPGSGEGRLQSLPSDYRDRLIDDLANRVAFSNSLGDQLPQPAEVTDADVEAFYEQNKDQIYQRCVKHILISTENRSDADAQQLAEQVRSQLVAGADFAQLASDNSDDPGSADQGGDLGCQPRGAYVPEFDDAVWSQEVGAISEPVQTDFGFHIIVVTETQEPTIDDVRDQIVSALEQQGQQDSQQGAQDVFQKALLDALRKADIEVDARYGTWDPDTGTVVPPEGPASPSTTVDPALLDPVQTIPSG
jgi:PPIC-type PPIASE domain